MRRVWSIKADIARKPAERSRRFEAIVGGSVFAKATIQRVLYRSRQCIQFGTAGAGNRLDVERAQRFDTLRRRPIPRSIAARESSSFGATGGGAAGRREPWFLLLYVIKDIILYMSDRRRRLTPGCGNISGTFFSQSLSSLVCLRPTRKVTHAAPHRLCPAVFID